MLRRSLESAPSPVARQQMLERLKRVQAQHVEQTEPALGYASVVFSIVVSVTVDDVGGGGRGRADRHRHPAGTDRGRTRSWHHRRARREAAAQPPGHAGECRRHAVRRRTSGRERDAGRPLLLPERAAGAVHDHHPVHADGAVSSAGGELARGRRRIRPCRGRRKSSSPARTCRTSSSSCSGASLFPGRWRFQPTTLTPPADLSRVRKSRCIPFTPDQNNFMFMGPPPQGKVDASGKFTISDVMPGKYRLLGDVSAARDGCSTRLPPAGRMCSTFRWR